MATEKFGAIEKLKVRVDMLDDGTKDMTPSYADVFRNKRTKERKVDADKLQGPEETQKDGRPASVASSIGQRSPGGVIEAVV